MMMLLSTVAPKFSIMPGTWYLFSSISWVKKEASRGMGRTGKTEGEKEESKKEGRRQEREGKL